MFLTESKHIKCNTFMDGKGTCNGGTTRASTWKTCFIDGRDFGLGFTHISEIFITWTNLSSDSNIIVYLQIYHPNLLTYVILWTTLKYVRKNNCLCSSCPYEILIYQLTTLLFPNMPFTFRCIVIKFTVVTFYFFPNQINKIGAS